MSEIVKSEYNALGEDNNYKTHFFKTSADQVVGLGRMKNTEYQVGDVVYSDTNNKVALKCTTDGTTSNAELDISGNNIGDTVTDGSVVWKVVKRDVSDEFEKYLPLSGGNITGAVRFGTRGQVLVASVMSSGVDEMRIESGESFEDSGGAIALRTQDDTTNRRGGFILKASTEDGRSELVGLPNGSLLWRNDIVSTKTKLSMPSTNFIDIAYTPNSIELSYIAPADGYLIMRIHSSESAYLYEPVTGMLTTPHGLGSQTNDNRCCFLPVSAGGTIMIFMTKGTIIQTLRFVYAKSEV